jgi:predicted MFS family arabinose efflux permease
MLAQASSYGWRTPFAVLAGLSAALFVLAVFAIPPQRGHLHDFRLPPRFHEVLVRPAHLPAYALSFSLVCSSFIVFPYLAPFLVKNVGFAEANLALMYLFGGLGALVSMNVIGRISDRLPRPAVFRVVATVALVSVALVTNLPRGASAGFVLTVTTAVFILTSGRMVPVMAMITSTAEPRYRGTFLSVNSSVQQFGAGAAPVVGGLLMHDAGPGQPLDGYAVVGVVSVLIGLTSLYLAGLLRPASPQEAPADVPGPDEAAVVSEPLG